MIRRTRETGMVLVFALWVLGVLTILAVSVASGIRQKIFLVARLDERSRVNYLLESAVKKAAGYIHQQMEESSFTYTPDVKIHLHNNTNELTHIDLNRDQAQVAYIPVGQDDKTPRYGVVDEESKINLNKCDKGTLTNLLMGVLGLKEEEADSLADALLDWRQSGESEITGFYSEDYYNNLQYPYPKKSADYETLDEILLVKGMSKQMYDKLINYVTIYGDGAVNINTASPQVLTALGLPESLVEKILIVRRGKDAVEDTADDHVFLKTFDVAAEINSIVPLELAEAHAVDALNQHGLLTTDSYYFTIQVTAKLASHSAPGHVRAVYSSRDDKIIYWKER